MPLEAINCTNCGSSDVKEVKAGTYFCDHCETVFKHIDPTRVTVQREFCECGRAVECQCRICHQGLCQEHARRAHADSRLWGTKYDGYLDRTTRVHYPMLVPTEIPAYRLGDSYKLGHYSYLSEECRDGYVVLVPAQRVVKIVSDVLSTRQGVLCSVCEADASAEADAEIWDAAGEAGDALAREKNSGHVCARVDCSCHARATCACCHLRFCGDDTKPAERISVPGPRMIGPWGFNSSQPVYMDIGDEHCSTCRLEWGGSFREASRELYRRYFECREDSGEFLSPVLKNARTRRKYMQQLAGVQDEAVTEVRRRQAGRCLTHRRCDFQHSTSPSPMLAAWNGSA
jgi:hypothetical protein